MKVRRWRLGLGLLLGAGLLGSIPGCGVGYLATQGWYQGRLLLGRIPVEEALKRPSVTDAQKARLSLIQRVRAFGEGLGLTPTQNYSTVNLDWHETIYNVTACRELAFEPYTWWFPVVGTVPYKGFFRKGDAEAEAARLQQQGWEVAVREVGGYSTLGWFKDPILPHMLEYEEPELVNLILHELTHATLFLPGKIDFNESFASFVADVATLKYLEAELGADSPVLRETRRRYADRSQYQQFMHALYMRLDSVYKGGSSEAEKRKQRAAVLDALPEQWAAVPFESSRYQHRKAPRPTNPDLLQFRRYSGEQALFARVLERHGGSLQRFFETFRTVARSSEDPSLALKRLAGEGPGASLEPPSGVH